MLCLFNYQRLFLAKGVLFAFLLIFVTSIALADEFDDLFSDVDTEEVSPEKKSVWKDLYDNSNFKLSLRSMSHYENATSRPDFDKKSMFFDERLFYDTKLKRGISLYSLAMWVEFGNQKATYRGVGDFPEDRDDTRRHVEFNEINWVGSWDDFDLTLGKKVFKMGISTLYSPSDRISPKGLNDPFNPRELGTWLAKVDVFKGNTTYSLAVIPFFTPLKRPHSSSRWSGAGESVNSLESLIPNDLVTGATTTTSEEEFPKRTLKNVQAIFKVKTTVKGWDFFLAAFHGPSFFPVLAIDSATSFRTKKVRVGNYSTGFSTTYKKFEFHGEGLYQLAYASKDDNYINFVFGSTLTMDEWVKYIGLEQIDFTAEFSKEEITAKQTHTGFVASSKESRIARDLVYTRAIFKYSENLRLAAAFNYDFDERGHSEIAGFEYKVRPGLIL
ncbi:MAG: hypothetical protein H8D23_09690, partial [Candidatus Brocadiales bacterium]|nr:hypothetical protein [Candidatus Brocadiales bacterium]